MGCVGYEDLDSGTFHEGQRRAERNLGLAPVRNIASKNYSTSAAHLRDQYADYFSGAGSVPSQRKAIGTDESCIIFIICVNTESFCATGKMCKICFFVY
jgi:hypothetical protein